MILRYHWTLTIELLTKKLRIQQKPNELIVFIICHIQIYMYKHIFMMLEAAQQAMLSKFRVNGVEKSPRDSRYFLYIVYIVDVE